jgi:hypothetical protein
VEKLGFVLVVDTIYLSPVVKLSKIYENNKEASFLLAFMVSVASKPAEVKNSINCFLAA